MVYYYDKPLNHIIAPPFSLPLWLRAPAYSTTLLIRMMPTLIDNASVSRGAIRLGLNPNGGLQTNKCVRIISSPVTVRYNGKGKKIKVKKREKTRRDEEPPLRERTQCHLISSVSGNFGVNKSSCSNQLVISCYLPMRVRMFVFEDWGG